MQVGVSTWYPSGQGSAELAPYMGFIATNGRMPDAVTTSARQYNSRSSHVAKEDHIEFGAIFVNWCYDRATTKLEINASSATVTAAVEYPEGVYTPMLFDGAPSKFMAAGGQITGWATVSIPRGARYWIREFRNASSSIPFLSRNVYNAGDFDNGERFEFALSGLIDKTMGGTIDDTAGSYPRSQASPIGIIGMTTQPSVLIIADSKGRGANDIHDATGDIGEGARSIGRYFGYSCCGSYGNSLSTFNSAGGHERQVALQQYASHILCIYGANDIRNGASASTIIARLGVFWNFFAGKLISHDTIQPKTTSSDGWIVNQVPDASEAVRVDLNEFLRPVPAPLWATHEVSDVVEDGRNTGRWKTDGVTPNLYTDDGTHETQYGYIKIRDSRAIDPARFVLPYGDVDTLALMNRMTVLPTRQRAALIDSTILALKAAGLWIKIDGLWLTAAANSQAAGLNWKGGSTPLNPIGASTFTADRGYLPNGTSSYVDTGLIAASAGVMALNSAHIGIYLNTLSSAASSRTDIGGADGAGVSNLRCYDTATGIAYRLNQTAASSSVSGLVASNGGHTMLSRTASNLVTPYKNGVALPTSSAASTSLPTFSFYLGANNSSGTANGFSNRRIAAAHVGGGFNATEAAALYAIVNSYLTAVGGA